MDDCPDSPFSREFCEELRALINAELDTVDFDDPNGKYTDFTLL